MKNHSVFLVDDDDFTRSALRDALVKKCRVIEAKSYDEAILLLDLPFECAVIDYSLGSRNGFEVLAEVRKTKPGLPAILITAFSSEDLAIKAIREDITDYLKKPFSLKLFVTKVMALLGVENEIDQTNAPQDRKDFAMDYIAHYLEENLHDQYLSAEKAASAVNMSTSGFRNNFSKVLGKSFVVLLTEMLIRRASELMRNNILSLTEIAAAVGFGNIEHFSRTFKRIQGMSPREYRKNLRQVSATPSSDEEVRRFK